ncbi:MAG TPA: hypothetical protein VKU89_02390 [Solirubrobacteraceae bacterium]|nr:hypothetical protein [Solirubrobacteraceae bacterium]
MSIAQRIIGPVHTAPRAATAPPSGRGGQYLTDGVNLFYTLGAIGESEGLVSLEDCRTLAVMIMRWEDVAALTPVTPAPGELALA